jgi:uncharacterized protein
VRPLMRLTPATTEYTVTRGMRVPMRDGVDLLADHYAPTTSKPSGTILVRGLYGRGGLASITGARLYAARGYQVVLQSVRGTFGSSGEFTPGPHEADDGADTVAWLREQPWFTGRFATQCQRRLPSTPSKAGRRRCVSTSTRSRIASAQAIGSAS